MKKISNGNHAFVAIASVTLIILSCRMINGDARQDPFNRKSIVFDLKTPKVFYCPQDKPATMDKMIVKAQPLEKLCQYEGKPKPKHQASDCYNDVDESEFACDEKKRFMIRLDLAGEMSPSEGIEDLEYIVSKSNRKKATESFKKY